MEREIKKIATPSGIQIEYRTYLIGKEKRSLANIYLQGGLTFDTSGKDIKGLNSNLVDESQNLLWRTVVVSIDGSSENIAERILEMRAKDYDFICALCDAVNSDKEFEEKKTN